MQNLLENLARCAELTDAELGVTLARRAGFAPMSARRIRAWRVGDEPIPSWVERECVYWLIERWSQERGACGAGRLWDVDRKYTRLLDQFTIAELMAMLRSRRAESTAPSPAKLR